MNLKNIFILSVLLVIFSISAISAEDITDDNGVNIISEDIDSSDVISTDIISEENLVQANDSGNTTPQSSIESSDLEIYYRNGTKFQATFFDNNGDPLKNQVVSVFINGVDYNRTTDDKGIMAMSINLDPGNYVIKLTNPVTKETASNNVTVKSTLIGKDLEKFYRNASQYTVSVLNGQGNPLPNAQVTFNINGVMYDRKADANGVAKLNINLNPGSYVITAEHPNGQKISNKITVKSTIQANNIKKYYKNGTQFYASFIDGSGKPLANKDVTFNINGVMYTRTTDANGTARLNINLDPAKYTLTSTNPVTKEEKGSTVEVLNKIEVKNSQTGGNISMEYKSGAKYNVVLHNDDGSVAKNKQVTFNINGVKYTRTSDENGSASLSINLEPGNYIITSNFENCFASNLIKVRITPSVKLVSNKVKVNSPIQFYLTEKNTGNPIVKPHWGFIYFNGTTYANYPNEKGLVEIQQNLPAGFRDIFYMGIFDDNYYSEIMTANTIEIVN